MVKRILSLFLVFALLIGQTPSVFAVEVETLEDPVIIEQVVLEEPSGINVNILENVVDGNSEEDEDLETAANMSDRDVNNSNSGSVSEGYVFLNTYFTYDNETKAIWGTSEDSILTLGSSNAITIDGTVQYSRAFALLDSLNEIREEKGLTPLTMDQTLLDVAVGRSAELAVRGETFYRPNGSRLDWEGYPMSIGEAYSNVASDSCGSFFNAYKNNENLLSPTNRAVGISIFSHNGIDYIFVILDYSVSTSAEQCEDQIITQKIDIGGSRYTVLLSGTSEMNAGDEQTLMVSQKNAYNSNKFKRFYAIWNNDSLNWTSSNPKVATVHDGVVTALTAGTTEITMTAGENTASFTITVTGEAAHAHTTEFVEGLAPTYYEDGRRDCWRCTVCDCMYEEEEAVNELTAEALVIPKLTCDVHPWSEGVITVAPTSSVEGNKHFVCVNCGAEKNEPVPVNGKTPMHSGELTRAKPTWEQLTDEINAVSDTSARFVEGQEPSVTVPYKVGKVTDELLNTGLEYLNYIRYSACLPSAKLSEAWTDIAQHGAVVLGAIDELTHWPRQPIYMDESFYRKGYEATSSSNISLRYNDGSGGNPFYSSIQGCMDDSNSWDNLANVGHRRWLLDPTLNQVGFGYAQAVNGNTYITTMVFENGVGVQRGPDISYDFISWPASGNMTSNVFTRTVPWSISLNPKKYLTPDKNTLHITLTRVADNTVWTFDKGTAGPDVHEKQYLALSSEGYGSGDCIIFSPGSENINPRYEGSYLVSVEGLQYLDGSPAIIYYEVEFRSIRRCKHTNSVPLLAVAPTCESTGLTEGSKCRDCGLVLVEQQTVSKLRHTDTNSDGKCDRCGKNLAAGLPGDSDKNDSVDVFDAVMLLQYINGDVTENDLNLAVSDVDSNNSVDVFDAVMLLQYINGDIPSL